MRNLSALLFAAIVTVGTQVRPAQANSDVLENIAAIAAAQALCGFKGNDRMVETAIRANIGDPAEVQEGGRHWAQIKENFARINTLTNTDAGRWSFCIKVKRDLSAFFD